MGWWATLGQQAASGAAQGGMDLGTQLLGKMWGAGIDRRNWEKAWPQQQKMMRFQQELGLDYWNKTNAEAQVQHLKKAGLNVGLMYGGSGPGGSTAQPNVPQGPATGMGLGGVRMQTAAEINLMNAQAEKTKAETEKLKGPDTENVVTGTGKLAAETENLRIEGERKRYETELARIQANVAGATQEDAITQIRTATNKMIQEASSAASKAHVDLSTQEDVIKQIKTNSVEQGLRILNQKKNLQMTEQQIKKIANDVIMDKQGNMREWDKLGIQQRDQVAKEIEDAGAIGGQGVVHDILSIIL